jgi:hypothetical protein
MSGKPKRARSVVLLTAPFAAVLGIHGCLEGTRSACLAPPPPSNPPRICRWDPVPVGWIAVDFVSDPVACPNAPGQETVYTRVVLDTLHQKADVCLHMCAGQKLPDKWAPVGQGRDPAICPREPGDTREGPTYFVIQAVTDL